MRGFLQRLKRTASEWEPIVAVFGGIASLLIAYFAYQIDQNVVKNAAKEARINRSVALAQGIINDEQLKELSRAAFEIENGLVSTLEELSDDVKDEEITSMLKTFAAKKNGEFSQEGSRFLPNVARFLLHSQVAAQCLGFESWRLDDDQASNAAGTEDRREPPLCDSETFVGLSGDIMLDYFFQVRPTIYCHSFFNARKEFAEFIIIKTLKKNKIPYIHEYEDYEKLNKEEKSAIAIVVEYGPSSYCDAFKGGING
jgi:hypothetical protein